MEGLQSRPGEAATLSLSLRPALAGDTDLRMFLPALDPHRGCGLLDLVGQRSSLDLVGVRTDVEALRHDPNPHVGDSRVMRIDDPALDRKRAVAPDGHTVNVVR